MSNPIITLTNINKQFGDKIIINDINASIYPGEVVALLGVNGAGKTTMINMMLGLETPSSGEIKLFGGSPKKPKNREHTGATPQDTQFPEGVTVIEALNFIAAHYATSWPTHKITNQFGLEDILDERCNSLSGGQKRRVALALAFIGKPKCVFLDEPTTGLDVESRKRIWASIQHYVNEGNTLFLTTHYLEEAEALATRILILDKGKIKHDGSVKAIKQLAGMSRVVFNSAQPLPKLTHVEKVENNQQQYILHTKNSDELVRELVTQKVPFQQLEIVENSLEQAFIHLAEEQ